MDLPSLQVLRKRGLLLGILVFLSLQMPAIAQDTARTATPTGKATVYTHPNWWFGVAVGGNVNFYRGSTNRLDAGFTPPVTFHNGLGLGLFAAPMVAFHRPDARWGFMLQVGYDSRKGTFDEQLTACDCPADLSTRLNYLTIEPNLRFAPFKSNFYLFGGPRVAFNMNKSYNYQLGTNPAFPDQVADPAVKGDFSEMSATLLSMQIGAAWDIELSNEENKTKTVLAPFVSFHPYFGQNPRTTETWNLTTVRVGAALKFGRGHKVEPQEGDRVLLPVVPAAAAKSQVRLAVYAPANIPVERRMRETFPIRNYVFFELGSTEIPERYVLLKRDEVKDFKEDQLEVFAPKRLSGRSNRQMVVYYNVLNVLGDRMQKNPNATVSLVGSSEKGPEDGKAMSASVKNYLVNIFAIEPNRIAISGRTKPVLASEKPGGTQELVQLREGDRRVSIETSSPALLMEFSTGANVPLKPVELQVVQTAPIESYVTFEAIDKKKELKSWSFEVKDEAGVAQNFGPYTEEKVSIPGKDILGTRPSGQYRVTMTGTRKDGTTLQRDTSLQMVLWMPDANEQGYRYSVIYEFNNSKAIKIYEKYLTEIVSKKIPQNGRVYIHGYTDNIGNADNNKRLSLARANDVRRILEAELKRTGRKDVTFEVHGFGEDNSLTPFENTYPEERFYNRTVLIDILPKK